jgi:hypothetical protein
MMDVCEEMTGRRTTCWTQQFTGKEEMFNLFYSSSSSGTKVSLEIRSAWKAYY